MAFLSSRVKAGARARGREDGGVPLQRLSRRLNRIGSRLRGRGGPAEPVLLFGHQRSGTNVTVRALAKHPDVTLYNEDHPVAFRRSNLVDFGIVGELARETDTPIALFKPISNTRHIFELGELYPEAKVILAIRHYLPVMHSFAVAFGERGDKALQNRLRLGIFDPAIERLRTADPAFDASAIDSSNLVLLSWCHTTQLMLDFFRRNPERARISIYEDLVADPGPVLGELFAFLGLRPPRAAAEGVSQKSRGHAPFRVNPTLRTLAERLYFEALELTLDGRPLLDRLAAAVVRVYTPADEDVVVVERERLNELRAHADRGKRTARG